MPSERTVRYDCLSAEQPTTRLLPRLKESSRRVWIAASHGARSASVKGIPWLIFSTLAAECSESPSINAQCIASASIVPTVVFPDPATPITTTILAMPSS